MDTELELKKPRKKREPAKYYVMVNENDSAGCFSTQKSALKFIKEKLRPAEYGLDEGDIIKIVKVVEKVVSTHTVNHVTLLSVTQLDSNLI